MTQTQRKQLDRAFAIAARDALHALRGTGHDGSPVYAVLNRTATRAAGYPCYHLLTVDAAAGTIRCDCPAHQNGRICAHRAAVRSAIQSARDIAAQAEATRQADAAAYRDICQHDYPANIGQW